MSALMAGMCQVCSFMGTGSRCIDYQRIGSAQRMRSLLLSFTWPFQPLHVDHKKTGYCERQTGLHMRRQR